MTVHGARYTYCKGCRCDDCRAANAAYVKATRHIAKGGYKAVVAKLELERMKRRDNEARDAERERREEESYADIDAYCIAHPCDKEKWRNRLRTEMGWSQ